MWSKSYSKTVQGLKADRVWQVWSDIDRWHTWQDDIEYAKLDGEFKAGNVFQFKPKGGPKINIELVKVEPGSVFVDLTRFPFATMVGAHEFIDHGDQLEIKTTISISGPLSFICRKLVAENVADSLEQQTERLIAQARNV